MKSYRGLAIFLQIVIVLIGISVLAFMILMPHFEGRNANATPFEIYFNDPFLAYVYAASIAFFVALYQGIKLLRYIAHGETFTSHSVKALHTIKYCGVILVSFIVGAEVYFITVQRKIEEDIAGGVMMGLVLIFISCIVATTATIFEKTLNSAAALKPENNLTL